jgi:hypothetical protein
MRKLADQLGGHFSSLSSRPAIWLSISGRGASHDACSGRFTPAGTPKATALLNFQIAQPIFKIGQKGS